MNKEEILATVESWAKKPSKKTIKTIAEFIDLYGEMENAWIAPGAVLCFDQGKCYYEVEFSENECQIVFETTGCPPEVYTPQQLVNYLKPILKPSGPSFDIGTLMDSMDAWQEQIDLGEEMRKLIKKHKLGDVHPEIRAISRQWDKLKRSFVR